MNGPMENSFAARGPNSTTSPMTSAKRRISLRLIPKKRLNCATHLKRGGRTPAPASPRRIPNSMNRLGGFFQRATAKRPAKTNDAHRMQLLINQRSRIALHALVLHLGTRAKTHVTGLLDRSKKRKVMIIGTGLSGRTACKKSHPTGNCGNGHYVYGLALRLNRSRRRGSDC